MRQVLDAVHDEPLSVVVRDDLYVAVGGLPESCQHGATDDGAGGWAAVGLGIRALDSGCEFVKGAEWAQRLTAGEPEIDDLDGHFVAARWDPSGITLLVDVLGVRTLFYAELDSGLLFSTRLDWVARVTGGGDLDLESFGGHWLLFNQMSSRCLLRRVDRLGAGGRLRRTKDGHVTCRHRHWLPSIEIEDPEGEVFARDLAAFVRPRMETRRRVSLGLSGGLDSRVLLALAPSTETGTHVFGPAGHPDVRIARRIARSEGYHQIHIDRATPSPDQCIDSLRQQVVHTQVVSPASSVLGLSHYGELHARGVLMIDGGFGELSRRQYMNRLLHHGREALLAKDVRSVVAHLGFDRAAVFDRDITRQMREGAIAQTDDLLTSLPRPEGVGLDNLVDLIGVRTRLPNFFGFEQNRLDGLIQSYMPFAQPSVLASIFRLPVPLRRNGTLVRRLVRKTSNLTRYPLVKSGTTYPFWLSTVPAHLWTNLKRRAGLAYVDPRQASFLEAVRPFVMDTIQSANVRESALYDSVVLSSLVEGYYSGRTELASAVDWWLAFEVWRQGVLSRE
jgi:hypothetical protein